MTHTSVKRSLLGATAIAAALSHTAIAQDIDDCRALVDGDIPGAASRPMREMVLKFPLGRRRSPRSRH